MRFAVTTLGLLALVLTGCGRSYHLSGHSEANLNDPPDIVLTEGERVMAISTGIVLLPLVPAYMDSSDPNIVEVEVPHQRNLDTAYLIAKHPGIARVRYRWVPDYEAPNQGFQVTVLPK